MKECSWVPCGEWKAKGPEYREEDLSEGHSSKEAG